MDSIEPGKAREMAKERLGHLHPTALIVDIFLRCQECKADILEPMDEAGLTTGPFDKIRCPKCDSVSMRMFWIEVPNPHRKPREPKIVTVTTPR